MIKLGIFWWGILWHWRACIVVWSLWFFWISWYVNFRWMRDRSVKWRGKMIFCFRVWNFVFRWWFLGFEWVDLVPFWLWIWIKLKVVNRCSMDSCCVIGVVYGYTFFVCFYFIFRIRKVIHSNLWYSIMRKCNILFLFNFLWPWEVNLCSWDLVFLIFRRFPHINWILLSFRRWVVEWVSSYRLDFFSLFLGCHLCRCICSNL